MNLHDQYQTLLRRGMPEHPRLEWVGEHDCWALAESQVSSRPMFSIHEDDARDLLTTHALEWYRVGKDHCVTITDYRSHPIFASNGDGTGCSGSPTILDAIIEATKHLEPKHA